MCQAFVQTMHSRRLQTADSIDAAEGGGGSHQKEATRFSKDGGQGIGNGRSGTSKDTNFSRLLRDSSEKKGSKSTVSAGNNLPGGADSSNKKEDDHYNPEAEGPSVAKESAFEKARRERLEREEKRRKERKKTGKLNRERESLTFKIINGKLSNFSVILSTSRHL